MLKRRLYGLLAATALILGTLVLSSAPTPAAAAGGTWCDPVSLQCYITLSSPPSDPSPSPDSNGWTAGAPSCWVEITTDLADSLGYEPEDLRVWVEGGKFYAPIACGHSTSYWSNSRQCYVAQADYPWPTPPARYDQDAGYYKCSKPMQFGSGVISYFWSNTVPPGLQVWTPGMAAQKLVESFQLRGVDIGMAPQVNPAWGHRRSYVGVPVWFWVQNPDALSWGPYTVTATLGGQTITATAQVTSVRWVTGDGGERVCGGLGTPYTSGYGIQDSPTCGWRYTATSENRPGDRYTVTAVSSWTVNWTSLAGPGGTINLTTSSATDLEVNELQTVNVSPNGTPVP